MSKFKVGDRVINNGDIGTVTEALDGMNIVRWDEFGESNDIPYRWHDSELKLVTIGEPDTQDTLTIRDQFAMAALTGMIASEGNLVDEGCAFYTPANAAERAYIFADAMLEARKAKS